MKTVAVVCQGSRGCSNLCYTPTICQEHGCCAAPEINLEHEGLFRRDYVYPLWTALRLGRPDSMDIVHHHLRKAFAAGEAAGEKKVDGFDQEQRLWTIIYHAGLSSVPAGIENAVERLCTRAVDADSAEDLLVKAQAEISILKRAVRDIDRVNAALESNAREANDIIQSYANTLKGMANRAALLEATIRDLEVEVARLASWTEK